MAVFEKAVPDLLQKEGGYVFDKDDPGGETKFGISKRSYPNIDIKNLSKEDAFEIYRRDFWNPLSLDAVKDQSIAAQMLDTAANMGTKLAAEIAQKAARNLGKNIGVDGRVGPITLSALNSLPSKDLSAQMVALRIKRYEDIASARPQSKKFLKGWIARAKSFGSPAANIAGLALAALAAYLIFRKGSA